MCLGSYYLICTYVSPITSSLVEEAVYPPHRGDPSLTASSEDFEEKEKDNIITNEKEVNLV